MRAFRLAGTDQPPAQGTNGIPSAFMRSTVATLHRIASASSRRVSSGSSGLQPCFNLGELEPSHPQSPRVRRHSFLYLLVQRREADAENRGYLTSREVALG